MKFSFVYILIFLIQTSFIFAQNYSLQNGADKDESELYAQTKQVNQFFRRFNSEEDLKGKRISDEDPNYRNQSFRRKYIQELFDKESSIINDGLKQTFLLDVTDRVAPKYLDFLGGDWIAEVEADFIYQGKSITVNLFFVLEKENGGSKWVLQNVYNEKLAEKIKKHTPDKSNFIHPLSHEIDFMNLRKVFNNKDEILDYTAKDFTPDYLTLFLSEIQQSKLSFKQVTHLKFHILQIENWYFELNEFNRSGYNSGWLISNLIKVPEKEKDNLIKFIYHEEE